MTLPRDAKYQARLAFGNTPKRRSGGSDDSGSTSLKNKPLPLSGDISYSPEKPTCEPQHISSLKFVYNRLYYNRVCGVWSP